MLLFSGDYPLLRCNESFVHSREIREIVIEYPTQLVPGEPDECHCLLYQDTVDPWTESQAVFVSFIINLQATVIQLGESDAALPQSTSTIGVKFGYRYSGSLGPVFYILHNQPDEPTSRTMIRGNIIIFTPSGKIILIR